MFRSPKRCQNVPGLASATSLPGAGLRSALRRRGVGSHRNGLGGGHAGLGTIRFLGGFKGANTWNVGNIWVLPGFDEIWVFKHGFCGNLGCKYGFVWL